MTRKGFTLIELLVVVAVLALLASIVFSNLGGAREGARISNALSFQSQTHSLLGSDLVGWWNFNDPSSRYKDLSGYENNGSCTSCPTSVDGVPGTLGSAMKFNGVGDYIETNGFPTNQMNGFSISFWINADTSDGTSNIILRLRNSSHPTATAFYLYNTSDKNIYFVVRRASDNLWQSAQVNNFLRDYGGWRHIIGVYKDATIKIYIDGEQKHSTSLAVAHNSFDKLFISSDTTFYKGIIDDVRIYSRALSAQEIKTLYAQTKDRYLAND